MSAAKRPLEERASEVGWGERPQVQTGWGLSRGIGARRPGVCTGSHRRGGGSEEEASHKGPHADSVVLPLEMRDSMPSDSMPRSMTQGQIKSSHVHFSKTPLLLGECAIRKAGAGAQRPFEGPWAARVELAPMRMGGAALS